ncbi:MAG: serine/threonine protein kinase [Polyangiaceae bacterium]|nr:serine/threonine protein kinase [Polyangiaceae bacterium]MCW5788827.1 serine/threonine protein kinase [Polyangiaceae bacterium]
MDPISRARERVGTILDGRYELTRLLGAGASGSVYDATHRYTERRVALKLLHPELNSSREHVGRFLREVRAMSALAHPGVAAILDAGRTLEDVPYLVTEFLEGTDMASSMEQGPLEHCQVLDIGVQLLDALAAAHERGIVHRDVKPDNVFLTPRGEAVQVKLLDFGIAKRLLAHSSTALTAAGTTVGTPHYMSPEQARGELVDHRSDLWSVGALLFHALSGEPPFESRETACLLSRIATEHPVSLGARCPSLDPDLIRIVNRALEPDRAERWQTAREMANALALTSYTHAS